MEKLFYIYLTIYVNRKHSEIFSISYIYSLKFCEHIVSKEVLGVHLQNSLIILHSKGNNHILSKQKAEDLIISLLKHSIKKSIMDKSFFKTSFQKMPKGSFKKG